MDSKPLVQEPLQSGFVEDFIGEFLVGKHRQGGSLGAGYELAGLFDGQARVLCEHRSHHAHHDLQSPQFAVFFLKFSRGLGQGRGMRVKLHLVLWYRGAQAPLLAFAQPGCWIR